MNNLLWSEEEIRVSPDGFLLVINPDEYSLDEEQPILLHTTSTLLRQLYPSRTNRDIFSRSGFVSEETIESDNNCREESDPIHKIENGDTVAKARKSIPTEYEIYQSLERVENLANRIHSALQDIRNFRHRIKVCRSDFFKESGKIRALQLQQNHLLMSNTKANGENSEARESNGVSRIDQGEGTPKSEGCAPGDGGEIDTDEAQLEEEAISIKLTRTINSIRALFPHLLPILNHERRNDKKLMIGNIRYKTKRNGAMCWLLGTESYSSCTLKQWSIAQDHVKHILESLIQIEVATEVGKDPRGSPTYWSVQWVKDLVKRSNPALPSPLRILGAEIGVSEERLKSRGLFCDQIISVSEDASMEGMDQQYKKAVKKIQQRLSHVLTSRFHGARVSISVLFCGFFMCGSFSVSRVELRHCCIAEYLRELFIESCSWQRL